MSTDLPDAEGGDQERLWNYLAYRVLRRLDEEQHDWRSVTSGQFSKLPCIADRYLIDRLGRRINFPRYWYKYGEVGNREPLENSLFIIEEADWGGLEVRPAKPEPVFDIDEEVRSDIDEAVEFVVDRFANVKIEHVKNLQYEYFAPNEFVQAFDRLRERIYDLAAEFKGHGVLEDEELQEELIDMLGGLISMYPSDRYEKMGDDFVDWAATMRLLIDTGQIGRAEAQLEEFWEVFSKVHLRMEHNNNSFDDQEERWKTENEAVLRRYRESLENVKKDVMNEAAGPESPEVLEESLIDSIRDLMD